MSFRTLRDRVSRVRQKKVEQVTGPRVAPASREFALVDMSTRLVDRTMVEDVLPDILGRALARGWIDPVFQERLLEDPKALLERYSVFLPNSILVRSERDANSRNRLVVYEVLPGKRPQRLLYLQLVMRAGR